MRRSAPSAASQYETPRCTSRGSFERPGRGGGTKVHTTRPVSPSSAITPPLCVETKSTPATANGVLSKAGGWTLEGASRSPV
jgi:hypothetical protein